MELAYLTTEYPAVSHTFIRREILELEQRGHSIHRFSIRDCKAAVEAVDKIEQTKTFYCLSQGIPKHITSTFYVAFSRPIKWFRAVSTTFSLSKKSERGLIRHLAYLAEAAIILLEVDRRHVRHIHVHFGTNATTVALLVKILGGPSYSFTVHGPDEFDAPIGLSLDVKVSNAQFVIVISQYGSAQLKRWAAFEDWGKIRVIKCFVSDDYFLPVPPIEDSFRTVLCVGRLSAQKGHLLLLDAIRALVQQNIDIKVVFAGDGELRSMLEDRIAALGLSDRVTITGWIDGESIRELLMSARGLILPSFAEGLPIVIMEAFAMKRPVVTTFVSGIPELVRHGENGFLAIAGDKQSLIDSMRLLMSTAGNELSNMGQRGCDYVRENHHVREQVTQLENQFKQILNS